QGHARQRGKKVLGVSNGNRRGFRCQFTGIGTNLLLKLSGGANEIYQAVIPCFSSAYQFTRQQEFAGPAFAYFVKQKTCHQGRDKSYPVFGIAEKSFRGTEN